MNLPNSTIRKIKPDDLEQIKEIYSSAFPEEDLLALVQNLHDDKDNVFSFAAEEQGQTVGHISFSECHVDEHACKFALLGPMAVTPDRQKCGVGSLLIRHGLQFLRSQKFDKAVVLGDPNYYGRFGFVQERTISPPYPLPKEWEAAWQSIALSDTGADISGELVVPAVWQDPRLWSN